jgi:hypothetical protein
MHGCRATRHVSHTDCTVSASSKAQLGVTLFVCVRLSVFRLLSALQARFTSLLVVFASSALFDCNPSKAQQLNLTACVHKDSI